jgi:hypothetical protein
VAACVIGSALPSGPLDELAATPLVLGAATVVIWLHALLGHIESKWAGITERGLWHVLPSSVEERTLLVDGLRLALSLNLRNLQKRVTAVLVVSIVLGVAGVGAVAVGHRVDPDTTRSILVGWPELLSLSLVLALLFGGILLAALRLRRLGRRFMETADALLQN